MPVVRVAAAEILPYLLQDISVKGEFGDNCDMVWWVIQCANVHWDSCMYIPYSF